MPLAVGILRAAALAILASTAPALRIRMASSSTPASKAAPPPGAAAVEALLGPRQALDPTVKAADAFVAGLFAVKPLYKTMRGVARRMISQRASAIEFPFEPEVARLESVKEELDREFESVLDAKLNMADFGYYMLPFHAYEKGNLCWLAAMEAEAATYTVHAPIYTERNDVLEPLADRRLRETFADYLAMEMWRRRVSRPKRVLDAGCSVGVSTTSLRRSLPTAHIIGMDLSPYMLAVGKHNMRFRPENKEHRRRISFVHGAAERSPFPDDHFDVVALQLVIHELPANKTLEAIAEAHRVLKPGGILAVLDFNARSKQMVKLANQPLAFAAFKSTEPWMAEFMSLPLDRALDLSGFDDVTSAMVSPRHLATIATKSIGKSPHIDDLELDVPAPELLVT